MEHLSERDLVDRSGVAAERVRRFVELGVLDPGEDGFRAPDVQLARLYVSLDEAGYSPEVIGRLIGTGAWSNAWADLIFPNPHPYSERTLAELDVPNFDAIGGALDGTTLYLVGGDAGVAIVDVSNPVVPVWKSTIDTPGIVRGVAISGPNEIAVADAGGPGLTFLDTSDRMKPIVLGSQPLQGNPIDVKVIGSHLYVATETRSYVVNRP